MSAFPLPDLGEGLQEAEIVHWHVGEGDRVVADQPLVSVETEKAVVEIPAPWAGTITRLLVDEGEVVAIGTPLVEIEQGAGAASDHGGVVGRIPTEAPAKPRADGAAGPVTHPPPGAEKATPRVRARARELGVELAGIRGSGPGGSITAEDVDRAAERAGAAAGGAVEEPVRGPRRAMAHAMARSGAEVVPATILDEVDVEDWPVGADVTARLVRAIARAAAAEPALNAWFDGERGTRRLHRRVDVGLAVDTPEGLFVPVLRDVSALDAAAVRKAVDEAEAAVRSRRAPPEALRDPTVSLSNFGTLAGRFAALAIVPPQVAIVGAGRMARRPAVVGDEVVPRRLLPVSLTFDHRAVTGGEAARFLAALMKDLALPE